MFDMPMEQPVPFALYGSATFRNTKVYYISSAISNSPQTALHRALTSFYIWRCGWGPSCLFEIVSRTLSLSYWSYCDSVFEDQSAVV